MKTSLKIFKNTTFSTAVLVLVLIVVAVSTSTYAWFSASNIVNVTTISFTANSNAKGDNGIMYISWDKENTSANYQIGFAEPKYLDPMMPFLLPEIGVSKYEDFINNFTASTESDGIYNMDGYTDILPITLDKNGDSDNPYTTFYLINTNDKLPLSVSVSYEMEGDLSEKLCAAIFADDTLYCILSNSEVYYGTIKEGEKVVDTLNYDFSNKNVPFTIGANGTIGIKIVAWLNGVTAKNIDIMKTAALTSLQFKGTYTTA